MADQFEITLTLKKRQDYIEWGNSKYVRRVDDAVWAVYDNVRGQWLIRNLTKSQAEQVKRALDEATKEK